MDTENDTTMAAPISGVRIYRYAACDGTRVAMHLPQGTNVIDITLEEAQRFAGELTQLVG